MKANDDQQREKGERIIFGATAWNDSKVRPGSTVLLLASEKLRKGSCEIYYKYFDVEMSHCTLQAPVDVDVRFADLQISLVVPVAPKILHFTGWCSEWAGEKRAALSRKLRQLNPFSRPLRCRLPFGEFGEPRSARKKHNNTRQGKDSGEGEKQIYAIGQAKQPPLGCFSPLRVLCLFHYNLLVSPSLHLLRR